MTGSEMEWREFGGTPCTIAEEVRWGGNCRWEREGDGVRGGAGDDEGHDWTGEVAEMWTTYIAKGRT